MGGRVPRGRDRRHDRVPKLYRIAVAERDMLELDSGARGEIPRGTRALDEHGQSGDVVGLHVRLEDSRNRGARLRRRLDVLVDELEVWIDYGELPLRRAAEEITCARAGSVEKLSQDQRGPQLASSTGSPARRHSGKPTSSRRARKPRARSNRTASSA